MKRLILLFVLSVCGLFAQTSTAANVGDVVTLTGSITAGTGPITWTWLKDGKVFTPATAPVNTDKTSVLVIKSAALADAGSYQVNAYNTAGNVTSVASVLVVNQVIKIIPPSGAGLTITVTAGPSS